MHVQLIQRRSQYLQLPEVAIDERVDCNFWASQRISSLRKLFGPEVVVEDHDATDPQKLESQYCVCQHVGGLVRAVDVDEVECLGVTLGDELSETNVGESLVHQQVHRTRRILNGERSVGMESCLDLTHVNDSVQMLDAARPCVHAMDFDRMNGRQPVDEIAGAGALVRADFKNALRLDLRNEVFPDGLDYIEPIVRERVSASALIQCRLPELSKINFYTHRRPLLKESSWLFQIF